MQSINQPGASANKSNSNDPNCAQSLRKRSASRDSSANDDPRSLIDSISAASGHQNWGCKELAEDDPSISSIKGDSVSATIADYNRKYRAQQIADDQSRTISARLGTSPQTDDLSSNINFYAAGGSASESQVNPPPIPGDIDNFDIIEERSNGSSCDHYEQSGKNRPGKHHKHHQHHSQQNNLPLRQQRESAALLEQALEIDDLPQEAFVYQSEPIIIRGNGNLTLFGLSNSFSSEFPAALIGRVSREEFDQTMRGINNLLREQQSLSAKLLLFGGLCCCCSLGFSLFWPSIALKKRSKTNLQKLLASENSRFYSKLGLTWKLAEQRCYSNHSFVEHALMIEFNPKLNIHQPD